MFSRHDWDGWRIYLDSAERKDFTLKDPAGVVAVTTFLGSCGIPAPVMAVIAPAMVMHLAWQLVAMQAADEGNGVILFAGQNLLTFPGLIVIPYTRGAESVGQWSRDENSEVTTNDNDLIRTRLDHAAVAVDNVEFVLLNHCASGWSKAFVLRDGEGSEWIERAPGHGRASNGLWAGQVKNGQEITFMKPKTFGVWSSVISIGEMEHLVGGDRVTFTWERD